MVYTKIFQRFKGWAHGSASKSNDSDRAQIHQVELQNTTLPSKYSNTLG